MKVFSLLLSLCLAFSSSSALAQGKIKSKPCKTNGTDLVFPKGKKFQVLSYDADTETFEINSPEFPGEGNSNITLAGLLVAVPSLKIREIEIKKNPEDLVDSVHETKKDLPTLFPEEKAARVGCLKK